MSTQGEYSRISEKVTSVQPRHFSIHVLNDSHKNLEQRAEVIRSWTASGGVLLMGYELYRQLNNRKRRRCRGKQAASACIDLEQEDREKLVLDGEHLVLLYDICTHPFHI